MADHLARWAIGFGCAAALCVGVGSAVGNDAVAQVNRFYTSPPVHLDRPAPMPTSSPWDWDRPPIETTRPISDYTNADVIVGSRPGDGSDLGALDRAVEREAVVRVHRGRPAPPVAVEADSAPPAGEDDGFGSEDPTA